MNSLRQVFEALSRMREEGLIRAYAIGGATAVLLSDPLPDPIVRMFERKRAWHRAQAALPLKEKVRILLELQRQELPLLARQRPLRSWERPWDIAP